MKKSILLLPIMAVLLFSVGCGQAASTPVAGVLGENTKTVPASVIEGSKYESNTDYEQKVSSESTVQPTDQEIKETEITGVSIDFEYVRMSGKASNQIAIWVEDERGETIKTLFVTDFAAARRGYENREDALKHWVAAADPRNMTDTEIDAISSATPQAGPQHFDWDLTDENGQRVPDGKYYIRLEGTLFWTSNVLYTGILDLMENGSGEIEITMERSEPENINNEMMIQNVRMRAFSSDQSEEQTN